ncbi:DUF2958 domain-containing protein [Paremcibacter congregatus]|uniref:DUF2958 domain-containing protein n=1 Tax=Paremcibacter congregatus TaxID=2043170 RepID=UPI0030EC62B3
MQLIPENTRKKLIANWQNEDENKDPFPVVKLFNPVGAATWLITEMVLGQPDILFGLCDLGFQSSELGYVSLSELENIRLFGALSIERDRHFTAEFPLSVYAQAARIHGQITFEEKALLQAKAGLESEKRRLRN